MAACDQMWLVKVTIKKWPLFLNIFATQLYYSHLAKKEKKIIFPPSTNFIIYKPPTHKHTASTLLLLPSSGTLSVLHYFINFVPVPENIHINYSLHVFESTQILWKIQCLPSNLNVFSRFLWCFYCRQHAELQLLT